MWFVILLALIVLWPLSCLILYRVLGWHAFEQRFMVTTEHEGIMTIPRVSLRRWGSYHYAVQAGIDDRGLYLMPRRWLLFHQTLYVAWSDIYAYTSRNHKYGTSSCYLDTQIGQIRVHGSDIASIIVNCCMKAGVPPKSFL